MKTILLLLSISPFILEKANSYEDPSKIKYAEWRPKHLSDDDDSGLIFSGGPHGCTDCVKGPMVFPVGLNNYRQRKHRRPAKYIEGIPDRFPESPKGQANQIPGRTIIEIYYPAPKKHDSPYPYRPSPSLPHKPCPKKETVVIPEKPSSGSGPLIPAPCGEKPRKCPFKGRGDWNRPVRPEFGSHPKNLDSCECGITDYAMMIIEGDMVDPPYKYPWMVALQKGEGFTSCGGAIISNQYILTAAHCLAKGSSDFLQPSEIQVAFVTNTYRVSEGEDVAEVIVHPEYKFLDKDHDIALLRLKKAIQCSEERRPICLPTPGMKVNVDDEFIIAGWGSREGGTHDASPYLMETGIKLVDFGKCSAQFGELRENFHCLQGLDNSSPCNGDSGGPMFSQHETKFYVYGVASMHSSHQCDASDVFVYTKVQNYLDWINSEMRR